VIAADTTVAVAAAYDWHTSHDVAFEAIERGKTALPAHAALETFSALTGFPRPRDVPPDQAWAYIRGTFARPYLLPPPDYDGLLELAVSADLRGGSIYDALIGVTASHAGATLLTLDRRAQRVYDAVGVKYELLT
jgi:predicted nucleic acid-binding protein